MVCEAPSPGLLILKFNEDRWVFRGSLSIINYPLLIPYRVSNVVNCKL